MVLTEYYKYHIYYNMTVSEVIHTQHIILHDVDDSHIWHAAYFFIEASTIVTEKINGDSIQLYTMIAIMSVRRASKADLKRCLDRLPKGNVNSDLR